MQQQRGVNICSRRYEQGVQGPGQGKVSQLFFLLATQQSCHPRETRIVDAAQSCLFHYLCRIGYYTVKRVLSK